MTNEQKNKLKSKIIEDIKTMQNEIECLKEKTEPITPDCSLGRLTRQEMIQEQQVYEHAMHEAEIRVKRLEYALGKVDSEDYGICAECEEDIVFERLMLLPESTHCVSCKSELNL